VANIKNFVRVSTFYIIAKEFSPQLDARSCSTAQKHHLHSFQGEDVDNVLWDSVRLCS
jgi:hypothetical protein